MKPTQIAELFANIRKTFVSFFSILMFVALGVGIFLGISWTAPALQNATENMYDQGAFHCFQIQYPYGLTDADIQKIAAAEDVTDVEPVRQSFQTFEIDGKNYVVKVQTLGQRIDVPIVVEGALPTQPNEVALNEAAARRLGVNVGDTITFKKDGGSDAQTSGGSATSASANSSDASTPSDVSAPSAASDGSASAGSSSSSASASSSSASTPASSSSASASASSSASSAPAGEADSASGDSGMKYLNAQSFKVCALVNSPEYLAKDSATYGFSNAPSGAVDMIAWAPAEAFKVAAFSDGYPSVNVMCAELDALDTFTDAYKQKSSEIQSRLTELCRSFAEARYNDLHGQAQSKVDEGQKKLDDGKKQIEEGQKKLDDAKVQYEKGKAELEQKKAEGEAKLAEAHEQLMQFEAMREEGEAKLAEARKKVSEGEKLINEMDSLKDKADSALENALVKGEKARKKYEESKQTQEDLDAYYAKLDELAAAAADKVGADIKLFEEVGLPITHENYFEAIEMAREILASYDDLPFEYEGEVMTVGEARKKLKDAKNKLSQAEATLAEKEAQLDEGWSKYYAGQEELEKLVAEGEKKLADGKKEMAEGEKKLADAKKEVAENEPKLEDAKQQLAQMKGYNLSVIPRTFNPGISEVSVFSGVTTNLSFSMAALFIIVGLLVSYSAVSRIVHEQITQIGTKKALGLRSREITASFLAYSAIAVIVGAIVGTIVGITLVEGIIGHVLGGMFIFGDYPPYFGLPLFLVVTGLELVLVLGATWLACRKVLREQAVELLKGEKPPEGKTRFYEKWPIWDKLPLFTQTIVNNCMNDKRRVFSTIVGVAGCTALIVTALTLNNDVMKSYDRHYENVYGFNAIAYAEGDTADGISKVEQQLRSQGATTAQALRKSFVMEQPDGSHASLRLIVPAYDNDFAEIYHVHPMRGEPYNPEAEGVWLSQAYAEHQGAKVGDTVMVEDSLGNEHKLPILGFNEFWLTYHEAVIPAAYYEREFAEAPTPNVVLANTRDKTVEEIRPALAQVEEFDSITDDKIYQSGNFTQFSSVSRAVVLIYMALSVLMAIVVLLNLNVMFIDEKKRELIVLMINGFSSKHAKRYIYNDTIVLSAIGILLGVVLGCIMGSITVAAIEPSTATFVKDVDWPAVLAGMVGSAVLTFVMSFIALRRIPRFDLTDINKF